MKSKNQFLIWKIIYFLCTLSQLYILCWDCFFLFFSYTHHLSLPPSPVKPIGTLPASSPVSPSLPFPSLFLFLSFPFDITKREGGGNDGEPGLKGIMRNWLPLTAATSNSRGHWRQWRWKHQHRERHRGGVGWYSWLWRIHGGVYCLSSKELFRVCAFWGWQALQVSLLSYHCSSSWPWRYSRFIPLL